MCNDLNFVVSLLRKIKNEDIMQCDEECFTEWESVTVYFNINEKLVVMHPM